MDAAEVRRPPALSARERRAIHSVLPGGDPLNENRSLAALTCPKCGGAMRTFERSGVLIDQCTECRGIYLDRGELDRIVDAESPRDRVSGTGSDGRRPTGGVQDADGNRHSPDGDGDDGRWAGEDDDGRRSEPRDGASGAPNSQVRKRGGLLGDVFDIFGGGG
jgi:Zn-finger nucleic acid-binding protein